MFNFNLHCRTTTIKALTVYTGAAENEIIIKETCLSVLCWLVGGDGGRKRGNASSSLVTSENMYVQVVSFCLLKLEH